MRFMMFVANDPDAEPYSADEDNIAEWGADVGARGVWVDGSRLRPVEDATTVRVRDGELVVTEGPANAETAQIAGFDILECTDLAEAIEVASKHPMARFGRIELRAYWPFE
jgi:hypothetical protein